MLAISGALPSAAEDRSYGYEMKWDGIRALLSWRAGRLKIWTRNFHDVTFAFPELLPITAALKRQHIHSIVLDGEIVALTARGVPSFQHLQTRLGVISRQTGITKSRETPVTMMIFDVLMRNNTDLTSRSYAQRRAILESLHLNGEAWRTPPMHIGHGGRLLNVAREKHLEGIVAKKLMSPYRGGTRSPAWRKIKLHAGQELVIGGYTRGRGKRAGQIGALLVGYYDAPKKGSTRLARLPAFLQYAGRVGTGFSETDLSRLADMLKPLFRTRNPFSIDPRTAPSRRRHAQDEDLVFVRPNLVGQFRFTEWTNRGTLRHPSFLGIRFDKKPRDVIREAM